MPAWAALLRAAQRDGDTDKALQEAVSLSSRYITGRVQPDKSIDEALALMKHYRISGVPITEGRKLVTDVEVLQEIMHRYVAIQRRDAIQPAFDAILGIVDEVMS